MRLSLKRLPSRVKRAARFEIHAHWRRQPLVLGSVFYESFSGNGMLDNPEALFRELLAAPDLKHLTHVWALSDLHQYRAAVEEFADDPRVTFVRYGSAAYYRALADLLRAELSTKVILTYAQSLVAQGDEELLPRIGKMDASFARPFRSLTLVEAAAKLLGRDLAGMSSTSPRMSSTEGPALSSTEGAAVVSDGDELSLVPAIAGG